MSAQSRTVIIFGVGPNVGRAIAIQFAFKGFEHLILLSRDATRLEDDKAAILAAGNSRDVRIDTVSVDLRDPVSVQKALKHIDSLTQNIEVVIYNGARVAPSPLFETPVEQVVDDFKVGSVELFLSASRS
jgi:NAD(P)-dependent dehydrogenase (short-subunit alcohol dehydrogenase family)